MLRQQPDSLSIAADLLQQENERLRTALASCLRDRREADKVYIHATTALGPNQASNVLAGEDTPLQRRQRREAANLTLPSVDDLTS